MCLDGCACEASADRAATAPRPFRLLSHPPRAIPLRPRLYSSHPPPPPPVSAFLSILVRMRSPSPSLLACSEPTSRPGISIASVTRDRNRPALSCGDAPMLASTRSLPPPLSRLHAARAAWLPARSFRSPPLFFVGFRSASTRHRCNRPPTVSHRLQPPFGAVRRMRKKRERCWMKKGMRGAGRRARTRGRGERVATGAEKLGKPERYRTRETVVRKRTEGGGGRE